MTSIDSCLLCNNSNSICSNCVTKLRFLSKNKSPAPFSACVTFNDFFKNVDNFNFSASTLNELLSHFAFFSSSLLFETHWSENGEWLNEKTEKGRSWRVHSFRGLYYKPGVSKNLRFYLAKTGVIKQAIDYFLFSAVQ